MHECIRDNRPGAGKEVRKFGWDRKLIVNERKYWFKTKDSKKDKQNA